MLPFYIKFKNRQYNFVLLEMRIGLSLGRMVGVVIGREQDVVFFNCQSFSFSENEQWWYGLSIQLLIHTYDVHFSTCLLQRSLFFSLLYNIPLNDWMIFYFDCFLKAEKREGGSHQVTQSLRDPKNKDEDAFLLSD